MMEDITSQKIVSIGGLNSNVNHIQLSDIAPGSAIELQNFEPSFYGGYRRISGYLPLIQAHEEVDPSGAEGRILVVAFYDDNIIVARKQKSSNTYDFYVSTGTTWNKIVTGLTRSSVQVTRIRFREFNFNGTKKICFTDGVNPACLYDGTTWTEIKSTNTGANFANAGGNQAINSPSHCEVFKNHLFLCKDNLVVHSAPLVDYDFTVANGAGQIPVGFNLNQVRPFRDAMYVFGENHIKKIEVSTSTFVLNEVTNNIGCLAPESVQEIDGDLFFLAQDGFRPISGTNKIGDVNLEGISKKIQALLSDEIQSNTMSEVCSVLIRGKSQIRVFFSSPQKSAYDTFGIIGGLRDYDTSVQWEWSRIKGFSVACAASKYIGAEEYVIHGDYNGNVYRQEVGTSLNGFPIESVYSTPFLDFGDPTTRKTIKYIRTFIKTEGNMRVNMSLIYDWEDKSKINPKTYVIQTSDISVDSTYGTGIYGIAKYSKLGSLVLRFTVEGSGMSLQLKFSSVDTNPSFTIQGLLIQFHPEGKK